MGFGVCSTSFEDGCTCAGGFVFRIEIWGLCCIMGLPILRLTLRFLVQVEG